MKTINLTQGKVALVDDYDYEWLNQWKWRFNGRYAVREQWDKSTKRDVTLRMHRIILNTPPGYETDHVNKDKLDNRRTNLRVVTHGQNRANTGINKNNSSGYKGVSLDPKTNKWKAGIRFKRKMKYLGSFKDKKVAALAYNIASIGYHREFGFRNDLSK